MIYFNRNKERNNYKFFYSKFVKGLSIKLSDENNEKTNIDYMDLFKYKIE